MDSDRTPENLPDKAQQPINETPQSDESILDRIDRKPEWLESLEQTRKMTGALREEIEQRHKLLVEQHKKRVEEHQKFMEEIDKLPTIPQQFAAVQERINKLERMMLAGYFILLVLWGLLATKVFLN